MFKERKCSLCGKETHKVKVLCEGCLAELLAFRYPEAAQQGIDKAMREKQARQNKKKGVSNG